MTALLRRFRDTMLGRGDAAVTIPIFDGALKPNQLLEEATVVAELDDVGDLATDGDTLYLAAGNQVHRLGKDDRLTSVAQFDAEITALAVLPGGRLAVAIGGSDVSVLDDGKVVKSWREAAGKPFRSVNSLSPTPDGILLGTEGSTERTGAEWSRDLLSSGASGRLLTFDPGKPAAAETATGLHWPFGIVAGPDATLFSEAWRHRVLDIHGERRTTVFDNLPGYPSRIAQAAGGGYWLTVFAARTQLIEFVLREPVLRRRMMAEVDPAYWIAPALSSGQSFLEPLQGAGVKQMGQLKPWAPPRSYGLVVRLDRKGQPLFSLHSRVGGVHHGIVAAAECGDRLYVLSRGSGRLLALPLAGLSESVQ